jgi:hypothetical protein
VWGYVCVVSAVVDVEDGWFCVDVVSAAGLNVLDFLARLSRTKAWTTRRSAPGGASDPALDMGRVAFDARVFTVGLLARPDAPR